MAKQLNFKQWFCEMAGTDAIVTSCSPTQDYQVWGACSDLKKKKKKNGSTKSKKHSHKKTNRPDSGA